MSQYHASCHCGAVEYDVEMSLDGLATCNCSICGRTGSIMAFVPPDKVTNLKGKEHLSDYQFGKKHIHHVFCTTCGVRPLAWGTTSEGVEMMMINVRCFEGVDVHTLEVPNQYDGASL